MSASSRSCAVRSGTSFRSSWRKSEECLRTRRCVNSCAITNSISDGASRLHRPAVAGPSGCRDPPEVPEMLTVHERPGQVLNLADLFGELDVGEALGTREHGVERGQEVPHAVVKPGPEVRITQLGKHVLALVGRIGAGDPAVRRRTSPTRSYSARRCGTSDSLKPFHTVRDGGSSPPNTSRRCSCSYSPSARRISR